jgi:hypothetical protein
MFDATGAGVNHNDDNIGVLSGIYTLGPANGTPPPVPLIAGAHYGLAISGYNIDPLNAAGALMWLNSPFADQTAPDGAGGILTSWTGTGNSGTYSITLVGATFCEVPAPGAAALLGIGGLLAIRRRR